MHKTKPMEDFVIKYFDENVPDSYCYHNLEHTLYVVAKVVEIGNEEDCTDYEIELLKAAAFWHDTGYAISYKDHEVESCKLAKIHLPEFGYSNQEIDIMCGMIMATQIPQSPTSKLEQIIADADLEYLGTDHAEVISERLYHELRHINPHLTEDGWNRIQVNFLQQHHYFTPFCKRHKEPRKQAYLEKLKDLL